MLLGIAVSLRNITNGASIGRQEGTRSCPTIHYTIMDSNVIGMRSRIFSARCSIKADTRNTTG